MKESRLKINHNCSLVLTTFDHCPPSVELEYVERSPDPWYSDSETSVEIEEEQAREIVAFLREAFGWEKP